MRLSDTDRKKNQFRKDERVHLLSIMGRYGPLLDKSVSTLGRKEIWTAIEEEFRQPGFNGKTSAQLKKYWQNYKYHWKKAMGKVNEKPSSSVVTKPSEWDRYPVFVQNRLGKLFQSPGNLRDFAEESGYRSAEMYGDNEEPFRKLNVSDGPIDLTRVKIENTDEITISDLDEKPDISSDEAHLCEQSSHGNGMESTVDNSKTRNHVVVSSTKISNNSVTVSVIYPESNEHDPLTREPRNIEADRFKAHPLSNDVPRQSEMQYRTPFTSINDPAVDCTTMDLTVRHKEIEPSEGKRENPDKNVTSRVDFGNDSLKSADGGLRPEYENELKARAILHQLEVEEKRLKVKIAEMTIQEIRLRMQSLNEEMRRTQELHRLHLALMANKSVASEFPDNCLETKT